MTKPQLQQELMARGEPIDGSPRKWSSFWSRGLVMVVGAFSLAAILHFLREMAAQAAAQAAQNLLQCVTALQQSLRMLEHFLELWPKLRLIRNRPFLNI